MKTTGTGIVHALTSQDHPPSWRDATIWTGTDSM